MSTLVPTSTVSPARAVGHRAWTWGLAAAGMVVLATVPLTLWAQLGIALGVAVMVSIPLRSFGDTSRYVGVTRAMRQTVGRGEFQVAIEVLVSELRDARSAILRAAYELQLAEIEILRGKAHIAARRLEDVERWLLELDEEERQTRLDTLQPGERTPPTLLAWTHALLAVSYVLQGRTERATEALDAVGEGAWAHVRALVHARAGRTQETLAAFEELLRIDRRLSTLEALGLAAGALESTRSAHDHYRRDTASDHLAKLSVRSRARARRLIVDWPALDAFLAPEENR